MIFSERVGHKKKIFQTKIPKIPRSTKVITMTLSYEVILVFYENIPQIQQQQLGPLLDLTVIAAGKIEKDGFTEIVQRRCDE